MYLDSATEKFIVDYPYLFETSKDSMNNYTNLKNFKDIFLEKYSQIDYTNLKINRYVLKSNLKKLQLLQSNNSITEQFIDNVFSRYDIKGQNYYEKTTNIIKLLWNNLILFSSKHDDWAATVTKLFDLNVNILINSCDKSKNYIYMYSFIDEPEISNNIFKIIKNNTNVRYVSGLLRELDRDRHFLGFYVVADNIEGCATHSFADTNSIPYYLPIIYGEDNFYCASNPIDICQIWANFEKFNILQDEPIIFTEPFNTILPYFRYLNMYSEIINEPNALKAYSSLMASKYFLTNNKKDKKYAMILSGFHNNETEFDKFSKIGQRSSQWLNSTLSRITEKTNKKDNFVFMNKKGDMVESLD